MKNLLVRSLVFVGLLFVAASAQAQCTTLPAGQTCVSVATLTIVDPAKTTDHIDIKAATAFNLGFVALDSIGQNITRHKVSWSVGNTSIATISTGGRLTGVKVGQTVVTLKVGLTTASLPVFVIPSTPCTSNPCSTVAKLRIVPVLIPGDTSDHMDALTGHAYSLGFVALDSTGHNITRHTVAWYIYDATVASITTGGRLTGKGAGNTNILLRVGNTTTTLPACVSNVALYTLLPSYVRGSIVQGDSLTLTVIGDDGGSKLFLGIGAMQLHETDTLQLIGRDAARNFSAPMDACVHWKSTDTTTMRVNRRGLVVTNGPQNLPGLRIIAATGVQMP
jgi:Big-like domain-containing protein